MTSDFQSNLNLDEVLRKAADLDRQSHRRRFRALLSIVLVTIAIPIVAALITFRLKQEAATAINARDTAKANYLKEVDALSTAKKQIIANKKIIKEQEERVSQLKKATGVSTTRAVDVSSAAIERLEMWLKEKRSISPEEIQSVLYQIEQNKPDVDKVRDLAIEATNDNQTPERRAKVEQLTAELAPEVPPPSLNLPSPSPNNAAVGRIQFLLGGPDNTSNARKKKIEELEKYFQALGYGHETGRTDMKRAPATLEVRYYHYPDDRAEAEKILQSLRKKEKIGPEEGRISYVIDPAQPRHTFQVAFPREADQLQGATAEWGVQISFGTDYSSGLPEVKQRLKAIKETRAGRKLPLKVFNKEGAYSLIVGPYSKRESLAPIVAQFRDRNSDLAKALRKSAASGLHWITPRVREVQISGDLGRVVPLSN